MVVSTLTFITRLEMKGFKSFANKTELLFGDDFNCVLGPNGSGKSNVMDAICFVLGKSSAKGLRAEKSSNLIYNGGKTKSPAKEGSVLIGFNNKSKIFGEDYGEELIIERRVRQSGSSVYKINGKTNSRQQVVDTLSKAKINPDGYNIILQGDINKLIEMTPNHRREIIEEIAGISIYEEKKQKAIRELDRVENKLNEAEIILSERETYLKGLKKERDQAQKFKDLQEKISRNKITIINSKVSKKEKEIKDLEDFIKKNNEKIEKNSKKIKKHREEADKLKSEIEEINKEVEQRGEKEQVAVHKEVEALKVSIAVKNQRAETIESEILKLRERKDDLLKQNQDIDSKMNLLVKNKDDLKKRIKIREESIDKLEKRITEFKSKHSVEAASGVDKRIEEIDEEAETIGEQISKQRTEQQDLLREKDRVEISLEQIDGKIAKLAEINKKNKVELDKLKIHKENFKKSTKELSQAMNEDSNYAAQLQNARGKLLNAREELSKLQSKQSGIHERMAGGMAIQRILELKKQGTIKGIHGTIAELGNVSKEHALALEIAAGSRMTSIVVDDDKVAAQCISYLKQNKLGVATFLPMNKIRAPVKQSITLKTSGNSIKGFCTELVSYEKKYDQVFKFVFGNTVVVDNIETARKIGVGKIRMVTLTGDLVETSGAMRGGYLNPKRMGIGFQEKEVQEEIKKLEKELSDNETLVSRLEQKRKDNEELIQRLREHKASLEGEIIKLEKSLHLDQEDIGLDSDEKKRLKKTLVEQEKRMDSLMDSITELTSKLGYLKAEKQQLRDKISTMRSPSVLAELNSFEDKRTELKTEIAELSGELKNSDSEIKNILGPEYESITKILKQHDSEIKAFEKEKKTLDSDLNKEQKSLKSKEEAEEKFFKQFKELFTKRNKLNDKVSEFENKIRILDDDNRTLENKNSGVGLENARISAELAGLKEEANQFKGVEPYKNKPEEEILLEIKQFERLMETIGAVNMKALEIYEKVKEEYDVLVNKKNGLQAEREDVLLMINEIDSKKTQLFMNTFEVVDKNFQAFFKRLSTKGTAYLDLENQKSPLEGGMFIKVKLSGKKYMDIRSLSGGEKTMTALAFLFAVQEHEPASFYIMDEVDAALDKNNSGKLASLVREYCENAQYLIISHNDGVIAEADNLFGVSMNEHGVSKVTTLKI